MRIGGQDIPLPLVLSPMVDVTDAAFRSVAREWGADVTCSEMVAAIGLLHDNQGAWRHVEPWRGPTPAQAAGPVPVGSGSEASPGPDLGPPEAEEPYGVQFMTGDPREMGDAVRHLGTRLKPDFVDVNLGCPAPNILRSCAGGFLLRDPPLVGKVVAAARAAADDAGIRDVSVKLRLGPDQHRLTFIEVARQAEDNGAAWCTLHARTVEQGYSGTADWGRIAELVRAVDIPVVGNGDLRTPADVVRMRDTTGCAGFFIARAAMHDPTIFRRMRAALDGPAGAVPATDAGAPSMEQRLATLATYLRRAQAIGITNLGDLRRQATRFVAGGPGARQLRVRFQHAASAQEMLDLCVAPPAVASAA